MTRNVVPIPAKEPRRRVGRLAIRPKPQQGPQFALIVLNEISEEPTPLAQAPLLCCVVVLGCGVWFLGFSLSLSLFVCLFAVSSSSEVSAECHHGPLASVSRKKLVTTL